MKTFYQFFTTIATLSLSFSLFSSVGLTQPEGDARRYPDSYISSYMKTCIQRSQAEGLPQKEAQSLCNCTINRFQAQYSFEEFNSLTQTAKNNSAAAQRLTEVGEACFEQVLYEQ